MYQVKYSKAALRALLRMPADQAARIRAKIEQLARDPYAMPGVKKLAGTKGYRLRVGDWRVLYLLEDDLLLVIVVKIGPRGGVYE